MKFTKLSPKAFEQIQINAGIVLPEFDPETAAYDPNDIIASTDDGGFKIDCVSTYTDFGEDIANCPKNTMELMQLESWDCKISGTFLTVTTELIKRVLGAADIDPDTYKITPRRDVTAEDFHDLWWVGDYSDKNGENNGGFLAVHLMNALSTDGLSFQSGDKKKGSFTATFTGHVSMAAQDVVPMEFFLVSGKAEPVVDPDTP